MSLKGKVALVTGASRGVGKGVALALGAAGATVYITGRTLNEGETPFPLSGAITSTAEDVTKAGGKGIAVRCDHRNDEDVQALFEQIKSEQGHLDILVNNVWAGYEGFHDGNHFKSGPNFWQKPIAFWDENLMGVRATYVASALAAPMMIEAGKGLIVNISFGVKNPGNPAYAVAKTASDRMAWDFAHELREHNVAAVALYPGLVRTEGVLLHAAYFDMSNSESPEFTGRAVVALASDPEIMSKSGQVLVSAVLAQEYGFIDIDGKLPKPVAEVEKPES
jgi:dehydrogenase/reductase SDR family member 1